MRPNLMGNNGSQIRGIYRMSNLRASNGRRESDQCEAGPALDPVFDLISAESAFGLDSRVPI
jgi:hypothetical protein